MEEATVALWNETVSENDTVYILGDFCWGGQQEWKRILNKMKGHKVLILGNHDAKRMGDARKCFDQITPYLEINDGMYHLILCHYPILAYNGSYRDNVFMLYGHVHVTDEQKMISTMVEKIQEQYDGVTHLNRGQLIHVGCMMPWMNYIPRTIDYLVDKFDKKELW